MRVMPSLLALRKSLLKLSILHVKEPLWQFSSEYGTFFLHLRESSSQVLVWSLWTLFGGYLTELACHLTDLGCHLISHKLSQDAVSRLFEDVIQPLFDESAEIEK